MLHLAHAKWGLAISQHLLYAANTRWFKLFPEKFAANG